MKHHIIALSSVVLFFLPACKKDNSSSGKRYFFTPTTYSDADVQQALIEMENGDTIYFQSGNYTFTSMLSVDGKKNIVITGEGRNNTILSFDGQLTGAQSIIGTGLTFALFKDFTIKDPNGDGIKIKDSDGVTFLRVGVTHTNPVDSTNAGYGLYPVTSKNILIDDCYVTGASDAGIYVGQSEQVIVRNCLVEGNVAGIEIENCIQADVYNNTAQFNTGGILVFDLPNAPVIPNGSICRVYNNTIHKNDLKNFAPSGNIVANVPVGTGIMLLAAKKVEIFNNTITQNNIMGIGIVSFRTLETLDASLNAGNTAYVKYCKEIHIHDNSIMRSSDYPAELNAMATIIKEVIFDSLEVTDILYDGFVHPDFTSDPTKGICIQNNGSATFANVGVATLFQNMSTDPSPHNCSQPALPETTVFAPAI
ncbi:MAG: hypothetical protein KatS3mg031_0532 [Chitinophagales bacterium]|nr:MAG: hypothetical protein KatS3mg031_0532 [Chitinophagales bacterium]